jgi:hypothetical protein
VRPTQPSDEWDFVRQDDELNPAAEVIDAEHAAVHVERDVAETRAWQAGTVDPDDDGPTTEYFDDEEPEREDPRAVARRARDEHEPDLEEILESQHYAFPNED